jgi:ketosteroid isomerase-like protein
VAPSPAQRDQLFKRFVRALFRGDIDALYEVVTPDFVWSFHDGLAVTKSLANVEAIRAHLAEQKALFSAQRFHDVAYHAGDMTFMTFSRQRDRAGNRRAARTAWRRELYVQG